MEWIGWLIGGIGVAFGVRGEIRASRAEKRLRRHDEVTPWDEPVHHSGDLFTVRNSSARDVVVLALSADSPVKQSLVHSLRSYPHHIAAGDSLDFKARSAYTLDRPDIVIEWRFADAKEVRTNRRTLPPVPAGS